MSRILVVVHVNTFFTELFQLGQLLLRSGHEPTVALYPYPTRDLDRARCAAQGLPVIDAPIAPASGLPQVPVASQLLELGRTRTQIRGLLERFDPALVVLGGDMVGYDTSLYVQETHRRGRAVLLLPSTMADGLEQAEVYFHDPAHQLTGINRVAARLFPRWTFEHRGKHLLRESGGRAIAMELLGLAPPLPWIFNSSYADAIAIESEAMLAYYHRCGISGAQLELTGSLSDDVLAERRREADTRRRELYRELELPDRPLIVSPLPPDFLYVPGGRPECEFRTYPELVEFWVGHLAAVTSHNSVISLHPSVRYEEMKHIERQGRVRIGRQGTATLVPLCDLYVASVSSTIRWAIACGIPVINYDVYRYRYRDYLGVDGVLNTEDRARFAEWLTRLTTDPDFLADLTSRQRTTASRWGALDGKSADRVLGLIERLIARGAVTARRRTWLRSA